MSSVELESSYVIKKCQDFIEFILKYREEVCEKFIQEEMNKKRWFRKNYSREEVLKMFEDNTWHHYWIYKYSKSSQLKQCQRLITLAKQSDKIIVTEEMEYIFKDII